MSRRAFLVALGGAVAWPLAARAQQPGKTYGVAVLRVARRSPTTAPAWNGFLNELSAHGFAAGNNLVADMRWADEDPRGPVVMASELIQPNVDVVVVEGPEAYLSAVLSASPTIPVVLTFVNFDPLARGYIKSLAQPGGNITGVLVPRLELAEKQVDLLRQAFQGHTRLGVLWDSHSADQFRAAEQAARSLGLQLHSHKFEQTPYDVDSAFRALVAASIELLLVQSSPLFSPHGERIAELARQHRLPSMFVTRSYVDRGGLLYYGADRGAAIRLGATYVAKILKGAKPADLPVEQPTKYELIVNLKTAKAIGLEVPASLLLRADEVIE
jgi:putative ABC transport system substrate-binding protein